MSQQWHYTQNGDQQGPVSSKELKQLATSGEIQPDDLVWKEGTDDKKKANSIKGLFQPKKKQKAVMPTVPAQPNISANQPNFFKKVITKFTHLKTSQKILICCIGSMGFFFFLCCGIGMMGVSSEKKEVAAKIDEANVLWDQGEKEKATVLYQEVSKKDLLFMPEAKRPIVFGRLIDHAAESGDTTEIRRLMDRAKGFTPNCQSDVAKQFMVQVQEEKQAEKKVEEAKAKRKKESGKKLAAFRRVIEKYKKMPDRFAPNSEVAKFADELRGIQKEFTEIDFDPREQRDEARKIIELFESELEGKYAGDHYRRLSIIIKNMYQQMRR